MQSSLLAHLVSRERNGRAMLFFQSSSSRKCCSFKASGVLAETAWTLVQLVVMLLSRSYDSDT